MGLTTPVEMHAYSPSKMHMRTCMRACVTVQKLLCHGSYFELILSLARASGRLSFFARPSNVSMKSVPRRCSLKKSVQRDIRSSLPNLQESHNSSTQFIEQQYNIAHQLYLFVVGQRICMLVQHARALLFYRCTTFAVCFMTFSYLCIGRHQQGHHPCSAGHLCIRRRVIPPKTRNTGQNNKYFSAYSEDDLDMY